jgi:pyrroline-5-carboxylate reductase
MIRVGFIGYGSMGSMMLRGFIESGVLAPSEIIVSTRTKCKLDGLKAVWADIHIAADNAETAHKAKYVFICVEPSEVGGILREIKASLTADSVVVSVAGSVSIRNIESLTPSKTVRVIPSLTSEVREGISLICRDEKVTGEEAAYVESLFSGISRVKRVREEALDLTTDLTSCAPGFFAAILDEFVGAALRRNAALTRQDAEEMVMRTFYGTAKVLAEKNIGFEEMIERVATKGGITEEGVKALRSGLPQTFDKVFEATLSKRSTMRDKIDAAFDQT